MFQPAQKPPPSSLCQRSHHHHTSTTTVPSHLPPSSQSALNSSSCKTVHPPSWTGDFPVCISVQQLHNNCCTSSSHHPPRPEGIRCEDAVHRLQFSVQHHHPETDGPRSQSPHLKLAVGLPHRKAQQKLHFLHKLQSARAPPPILRTFYRGTSESILTGCITLWYRSCTTQRRKTLQRVVDAAGRVIGTTFPALSDVYTTRLTRKAASIISDPAHPFNLLPSGRRFRSLWARSSRLEQQPCAPGCQDAELAPRTSCTSIYTHIYLHTFLLVYITCIVCIFFILFLYIYSYFFTLDFSIYTS